jgi:nitrite reductase/ring-hydroxylating ferredoxin subunit
MLFWQLDLNRRHMGVIFFLIALVHGGFALIWYHGFGAVNPLASLFTSQGTVETLSDFRFQPLGFFALIIFFVMAATSHDYWNSVLGPVVWKSLHMMVYVAYGLVIAHLALGALQSTHSALPDWTPWASLGWLGSLHLLASFKSRGRPLPATQDWFLIEAPMDIERGGARVVSVPGGERIAVFRTEDDQFGAISNVCRHQAGPLGEGCIKDGLVTCPWHGFQYRLEDGQSPAPFNEKVETYEMQFVDGELRLNGVPLAPGTPRPLVSLVSKGSGGT